MNNILKPMSTIWPPVSKLTDAIAPAAPILTTALLSYGFLFAENFFRPCFPQPKTCQMVSDFLFGSWYSNIKMVMVSALIDCTLILLFEFQETVNMLLEHIDPSTNQHQTHLLMSAACLALGELGRNGPLPLPNEGEKSKQSLFKRLLEIVKSSKISIKIKER